MKGGISATDSAISSSRANSAGVSDAPTATPSTGRIASETGGTPCSGRARPEKPLQRAVGRQHLRHLAQQTKKGGGVCEKCVGSRFNDVTHLKRAVVDFYGDDPRESPDYGRIVSDRHHARLVALLEDGEIYHGGQHDAEDRYLAPTILINTSLDSPVMQEEIFGPILPVLDVSGVEEAIDHVNARPKPLGLYVFAEVRDIAERILDATESGNADINDCTIQPLMPALPFGGVGNSGMGKYHGEWGFRAYTNARGVLYHSTVTDPDIRYPPYPAKPA